MQFVVRELTVLVGIGALVGCSAGTNGGHKVCKDADSAQRYSLTWQDDIAEARHSGKITMDAVVAAQGRAYQNLAMLKQERYSDFCTQLDQLRAEIGF